MGLGIGTRIAKAWGKRKLKKATGKKSPVGQVTGALPKLIGALKKEAAIAPVMHQQVMGALWHMQAKDPKLAKQLRKAYGYAVFPDVGKASIVLGGAYGTGEVFERGRVIGYAGLVQVTLGLQVGGHTYHELVLFDSKGALDAFKSSRVTFSANAALVFANAGAAASTAGGMRAYVHTDGGMLLQADIGGQKFIFKPAVLGRVKTAEPKATVAQASKLGAPSPPPVH